MKSLALLVLLSGSLSGGSSAAEDLAARVLLLRARWAAGAISANERFELAGYFWRAEREDLARPLAEELTADPNLGPWAHYLIGQLSFQRDPLTAREAFIRARDAARLRGEVGAELVERAEAAIADCQAEALRPERVRESASRIMRDLWTTAGLWVLVIALALRLTRSRAGDARTR